MTTWSDWYTNFKYDSDDPNECYGDEWTFAECNLSGFGGDNCSHSEDTGVYCWYEDYAYWPYHGSLDFLDA